MKLDLTLCWIAVGFYGLSTFSYIFGMIAKQDKLFTAGLFSALVGFIPHVIVIGMRWSATGISPFISTSESLTLGVFMAVLLYLVVQFSAKKVRPLGVLVMPVAFVLLGWAGTLMKEVAESLAPALQSAWIWVHIVGASTGFAAVLIAAGLGLLYLLKENKAGGLYEKLPDSAELDILSYRFVAGGFVFFGFMMVSGCFWAN